IYHLDNTVRLLHNLYETDHYFLRIGYVECNITQVITLLMQSVENESEAIIQPILMEEEAILPALHTDKIDIAFTDMSEELKQHRALKVSPLFKENFHIYVPKNDPITLATNPPLVQ